MKRFIWTRKAFVVLLQISRGIFYKKSRAEGFLRSYRKTDLKSGSSVLYNALLPSVRAIHGSKTSLKTFLRTNLHLPSTLYFPNENAYADGANPPMPKNPPLHESPPGAA